MKTITTPRATLENWIEQMRSLGNQNNHAVKIKYDNVQALALFYVKGKHVDSRILYRI